jgi:O-antigen/teichoic acid export membrane protein
MGPSAEMHSRVKRGVAWTGGSQVSAQLIRLAGAIVVARLLTPAEYGLAMLALVFASLVLVFSDLALGAALVQRKELAERDRSTAFWVTIAGGALFTLAGVALSGPVAALYGEPDAQPLLAALSASFILTAAGATQQALLLRDMSFARLELMTLASTLVGVVGAVVVAAAGGGAWAIITQQLVAAIVASVLFWFVSPWRPRLVFSRASMRDLWGFSGFLVGHRLLFYLHQNADRFLIGRSIGAAGLGAYAVAYNVMLAPASRIGGPIQRVLAPAFSRMQDEPERIAAAWARVTRLIGAIIIPALAGLVIVAPDFVPVVLGEQWRSAIPIVQILAWVGVLQALQTVNVDILMARDRTSTLLGYSLGFTVAHITAFVIGLHWGITGVAVAYAISSTLVEPVLTYLTARALDVSPFTTLRALLGVGRAAIVMAGAVLLARVALVDAGVAPGPRLAICVAVGAVVFLALCAWWAPEVRRDVLSLVRRSRPPAPAVAY